MAWLRLYTDVAHDPKVQRLSPALFKFWITILCLAKENNGVVPSVSDVSFVSHRRPKRTRTELQLLTEAGLLDATSGGLVPHNWSGRQYKSDDVTARVQRFRERSKNVTVTPPETETETEQSSVSVDHPSDDLPQPPPAAAFKEAISAFLSADATSRVARLVDLGDALGYRRDGGFCAAIVKKHGHGMVVVDALIAAATAKGDPWEYVERTLGNAEARRSHAWGGRQEGAIPAGGAEGFVSVSGAEVRAAKKAQADEAARAGAGPAPG